MQCKSVNPSPSVAITGEPAMREAAERAIKSGVGFVMVAFDESKQGIVIRAVEAGDVMAKNIDD